MRLKSKRLVSLLLAGSMMVSMVPASAVTAFAANAKSGVVTYASETEEVPMVTVSVSGGLEQAFKTQIGKNQITSITKLAVKTTGDAKLNGDDFKFLSCVTPLGNNRGNSTYNTSYGLKSLVELALTDASCENDAIPESAFQNNTVLEIVYLPKNLKYIERSAFNCASPRSGTLKYVGTHDGVPGQKIVFPSTLEKIGQSAFYYDDNLVGELELPASLKTLGSHAFVGTKISGNIKITSGVTFEKNAKSSENSAVFQETNINSIEFENGIETIPHTICQKCPNLESIVIPQSVTIVRPYAFFNAGKVENIILNRSDISIYRGAFCNDENKVYKIYFQSEQGQKDTSVDHDNNKWSDTAILLNTNGGTVTPESGTVTYGNVTLYIPTKENEKFLGWYDGDTPLTSESTISSNHFYTAKWEAKAKYTVTFDLNGHGDNTTKTVYEDDTVAKPTDPTAKGYKFAGWYTDAECTTAFDFTKPITATTTVYAKWEKIPDHQLTVVGGTFTVKDETVETKTEDDKLIANVPEGAEVTVTFNKDTYADSNLTFGGWKIEGLDDADKYTGEEFTFTMPKTGVTIEALTKTADTEDDSWDAATVVTGVVLGTGAAVLTYHIGTELYAEQVLGKDVAVPKTREDVALKAWELAGKPAVELNGEPLSEAAQAEKWAVESGLMQNNAEGNFNGAKKMNKLKALRVLDAAKKLG